MPLVYQQDVNATTKIGVWHIIEPEDFFLRTVQVQREIRHEHKRLQHLAGRILLKELYPHFPVELILVADTKKPFLENEPFHFSISHCGDYAAVMVSTTHRVGVDIELETEKINTILHKFLTDAESFLIPRGAITQTATLFWSVKESIYKWNSQAGVDFKKHIEIKSISGNDQAGVVHCLFESNIALQVHYQLFRNNYLTWVLSVH